MNIPVLYRVKNRIHRSEVCPDGVHVCGIHTVFAPRLAAMLDLGRQMLHESLLDSADIDVCRALSLKS